MNHILSIVNHKGGVGKSTTAVNLAAGLSELGLRVLLIDLDPQGSASIMLGVTDDGRNLFQALEKNLALPLIYKEAGALTLVPSGPFLVEARQRFSGSVGNGLLQRCLERTKSEWDWVIIDCPPSLGVLTRNAFLASNGVIIPVEVNFISIAGLHQMIEVIDSMHTSNRQLQVKAIVPCRVHPRRRIFRQFMEKLETLYPNKLAPTIRESVVLAEAPDRGVPVLTSAPKSAGAEDYRKLAGWLIQH